MPIRRRVARNLIRLGTRHLGNFPILRENKSKAHLFHCSVLWIRKNGWANQWLTLAGIVSLMKSKLSAMVIYRASILSIPKTLAEQNDQKVFLVGGREKNPFSLIGKKKVTKSGLGIRNMGKQSTICQAVMEIETRGERALERNTDWDAKKKQKESRTNLFGISCLEKNTSIGLITEFTTWIPGNSRSIERFLTQPAVPDWLLTGGIALLSLFVDNSANEPMYVRTLYAR